MENLKTLLFDFEWVIYDHEKSTNVNYEKSTRKLCDFTNILDFWVNFNNIPKPNVLFYQKESGKPYYMYHSQKREVSAISIFRDGIQPKWEDPMNITGGELSLRKFYNKDIPPILYLNNLWVNLVLNLIGGQFTDSHTLTGARVVDSSQQATKKPLYRIELWFSDKKDEKQRKVLEDEIKFFLNLNPNDTLLYTDHSKIT